MPALLSVCFFSFSLTVDDLTFLALSSDMPLPRTFRTAVVVQEVYRAVWNTDLFT